MEETKVIYYIDDEETPYLVKIPISPEKVTLIDFKNILNRPNYKFFFKSMDDDFGVVKEEIIDDLAHLPCFNGRVVCLIECLMCYLCVFFAFLPRRQLVRGHFC